MCGIAGILNLRLEPAERLDRLAAMSARLTHRGPDSHGAFKLPHVGLAIRRLSIIDLETGDQPLSNETGEITLVFNGEIYNYRELRKELLALGHRFKTRSDGEVIAHLYEERGPDFVRELNGMYAIALWDERAKRLVLARDRAGEKPLYYWRRGETLVFASEIKALFEHPEVSRTPDFDALASYFFYGYFPAPASAYAEIRKLPAAHRMVVEGGECRIEPYWRLLDYWRTSGGPPAASFREGEVVEELRRLIREAAISRLVSDVPLGVFLSGGVDSSTLAALMSELTPGAVNSFSVSFREESFNEQPYAEQVASLLHTQHHSVEASERALGESLETLASHLDEPLADPAVLPTHLMSKFARQRIKVAFSGEGSDELFGGYPTYLGAKLAAHYLHLPRFLRRQFFERLARHLPVSSGAVPGGLFLRRFFAHAERDPAERHLIWFGMFAPAELDLLFSAGWPGCSGTRPSSRVFAPLERVLEGAHFDDVVAEMLFLDFRLYLEDNLLAKTDRASMACSLELRTPYLDHRLIEYAASLPSSLRVRGLELKSIMKKAVEKWLPRSIVYRQKRGFSVPIARWMRRECRPLVDSTLDAGKLKRQGLFDAGFVRRLLEEHWSEREDHRKQLWTLLTFQLWYDRWVERN